MHSGSTRGSPARSVDSGSFGKGATHGLCPTMPRARRMELDTLTRLDEFGDTNRHRPSYPVTCKWRNENAREADGMA